MNKKGFTLIELLSCITIMAFIATIVTTNVIKIFDNKKNIADNNIESIVSTAACIYIELDKNTLLKENCLKNSCQINSDTLIKEGLLKDLDIDKNYIISIYKENNEKKCTIK